MTGFDFLLALVVLMLAWSRRLPPDLATRWPARTLEKPLPLPHIERNGRVVSSYQVKEDRCAGRPGLALMQALEAVINRGISEHVSIVNAATDKMPHLDPDKTEPG